MNGEKRGIYQEKNWFRSQNIVTLPFPLTPHCCSRMRLNIEKRLGNLLESRFLWGADNRKPK